NHSNVNTLFASAASFDELTVSKAYSDMGDSAAVFAEEKKSARCVPFGLSPFLRELIEDPLACCILDPPKPKSSEPFKHQARTIKAHVVPTFAAPLVAGADE